jgi:hypothetical protein
MLKVNVVEPMRRNTAIAYCSPWIALYRVAKVEAGMIRHFSTLIVNKKNAWLKKTYLKV